MRAVQLTAFGNPVDGLEYVDIPEPGAPGPNQVLIGVENAEPLNGEGFYRFKIGDFQATVISDGYGQIPVGPILAMNASEAELAPVLKANFMQPVIQVTNNMLVVDTGRERILVDTGFGEKIGR